MQIRIQTNPQNPGLCVDPFMWAIHFNRLFLFRPHDYGLVMCETQFYALDSQRFLFRPAILKYVLLIRIYAFGRLIRTTSALK